MDISKLSPAPWTVIVDNGPVLCGVNGVPILLPENDDSPSDLAALELAALARNAFDIMQRRGWYSIPYLMGATGDTPITWIALNRFGAYIEHGGNTGTYFISDDSLSCLVEADKWYAANVEGK